MIIRQVYLLSLMALATAALFFMALHIGPADINITQAFSDSLNSTHTLPAMILSEIRLPRALLAIVVGATLGLAGAAMQGLLRNPLAGPGLVGVSNCAALGAVIALYFGWGAVVWFAVPAAGMVGAAISVVLIFMIGGYKSNVMTLLLAGVAVNAVASSLISLALNFAPNPYAMSEMVYWLLGSLANRSLADVQLATPFMVLGWLLILSSGRFLNALSLGEETAQSLGFHLAKQRTIIVIGVALSVGAAVSVSGNIGFVGLLVPHILRPLVGYEPGRLLAASAFGGALMVLIADIAVQTISPDQELKLGVVTALVGGPFFLYLIIKTRNTLI
ncbi:MAG: iron ABC transporter permease [Oceanicoccus sp.]|uniref:FecCD family ABC transporter permease n=1 Tax=Oceanicoccus sp. TaxID=2691044 RepID=UPI002609E7D4|nr:iron ABC transporter permease [Oceanicoccus sp.]MDG1773098.1 iron ABC transporter permease [Oceanicoccus sp.]